MSANDRQVGGDHYASEYEHWDFVLAARMGYMMGQVTRYVTRDKVNSREDLEKALHFTEKAIEQQEALKFLQQTMCDDYTLANGLDGRQMLVMEYAVRGKLSALQSLLREMIDIGKPTGQGYVDQDDLYADASRPMGEYKPKCPDPFIPMSWKD